jgi:PncC family amidohydrolase
MPAQTENSDIPLEEKAGHQLRVNGLTLATAESSTGGLIAKRLTDIPGSSAYMIGGIVAYADQIKQQLLGVRKDTLIAYGAVSEAVAAQMARGARMVCSADLAVSVTGIAGPGGATATKPVGLAYVGLSARDGTWVRRFVWSGDRDANRQTAVDAALQIVLDYLDGTLCASE